MESIENPLVLEELFKNFDMWFDRADDGLAALLVRYLRNSGKRVKITSMKGDGYIWQSNRKLWVESDSQQCKHYLREQLAIAIREAIRLLKDDAERTARLEKHLKRDVHKVAGFYGIFEVARVLLRVDAFESQLNVSDEDVVPILDGELGVAPRWVSSHAHPARPFQLRMSSPILGQRAPLCACQSVFQRGVH
jgi:hypothetical protein